MALLFFLADQTPYIVKISLWPGYCGEEKITESQNVKSWKVTWGSSGPTSLIRKGYP